MNSTMTTSDMDRAREVIEWALQSHDLCAVCGQPMSITELGGDLWIECTSLRSRHGLRRRLGEAIHERYRLDLPVGPLAA